MSFGDESDYSRRGIETEYNDDMPSVLSHNCIIGFDFVVAPLMDPNYRPSLIDSASKHSNVLPFAGSDLVLSPSQWSSQVVGKISSWIDLDSEDDVLREDSEIALKQELAWASHLSLQACLLPTPKGKSYDNYARCVTQILQELDKMQLWLRIPLAKSDEGDATISSSDGSVVEVNDSWELWNSFRLLCEHHSQLSVALDVQSSLPSISSIGRWDGEPVKAALLHTECYLTDARGDPCLSKRHQNLLSGFFYYSIHIVLSKSSPSAANQTDTVAQQVPRHDLELYLDYVDHLHRKMDRLSKKELNELGFRDTRQYGFRDTLQYPLQPLTDTDFTAEVYETFEKDSVKYIQYQRAVSKALMDRIPDDMASTTATVLMVVGAGRGPLVRASLQAAEETGRKLKVYAVEKNPNAVVTLHSLVKKEGWEKIVTVISCDMRCWDAPEQADILVSELLGSFGDNQLSPEFLDGAQRFLKPDGISIPSSYTSFIQPVTTTKLYNAIKSYEDLEVAHVVKLHRFAQLSPSQTVFTFNHPNYSPNKSNQRYKKLRFNIPIEIGSTIVHGFAGYFVAVLYKDVHISTEPTTATPNMFSWFPLFFPLRSPVCVKAGSPIDFHIWRRCGNIKVWYEWCVTSPTKSPVHNSDGRSSGIWLYNRKLGQTV